MLRRELIIFPSRNYRTYGVCEPPLCIAFTRLIKSTGL